MRRDAGGKLHPSEISLTGSKRGHVLTTDGSRAKWAAPSGGGSVLLGCASVSFTFPAITASDGTNYSATGASIDAEYGDADVSVSGTGIVLADSSEGFYVAHATLFIRPSTNCVTTDVHQIYYQALAFADCCMIGNSSNNNGSSLQADIIVGNVSYPYPNGGVIVPYCTGGTNRHYASPFVGDVTAQVGILRYSIVA